MKRRADPGLRSYWAWVLEVNGPAARSYHAALRQTRRSTCVALYPQHRSPRPAPAGSSSTPTGLRYSESVNDLHALHLLGLRHPCFDTSMAVNNRRYALDPTAQRGRACTVRWRSHGCIRTLVATGLAQPIFPQPLRQW
jgi:hypothetical protein